MIRRLRLKNFRRYEDETFEFSEGVTFIEGENNAGKTSILYAIEYALFGGVAQFKTPAALLRPKARAGGVEMDFEGNDGGLYRLQRIHAKPPRSRTKVTGHYTLIELLRDPPDSDDDASESTSAPQATDEPADEQAGIEPTGRYLVSSDFQDHEEKLALKIFELLGISKRLFEVAISTRQSETARILAGSPKLDIVLGITAVALAEEELRSMALQLEKQCKSLPVTVESLKHVDDDREKALLRAKTLDAEGKSLAIRRAELEAGNKKTKLAVALLQPMERSIADLKSTLEQQRSAAGTRQLLKDQLSDFQKEFGTEKDVAKHRKQAATAQTKADKLVRGVASETKDLREKLRGLDQELGDLAGRMKRRGKLSDSTTCETCGQPIDPKRAKEELQQWKSRHDELAQTQQQLQQEIRSSEDRTEAAREQAQERRDEVAKWDRVAAEWKELQRRRTELAQQHEQDEPTLLAAIQSATTAARTFKKQTEDNGLTFDLEVPDDHSVDQMTECVKLAESLDRQAGRIATAIQVQAAQREAELESVGRMLQRQLADAAELKESQTQLEREAARLRQEQANLESASSHAATLRLGSKAFQELQEKLRAQAAESLATNTLSLHRELSHSDEFTKLTIDPANYAVQVKAKDYDVFAPAAVFQGGGHRVLLGLAFKLAVAQMVGHCPFLLLDEPTDGLDEEHRTQLMERLGSVNVTRQMLVITHQGTEQETGHRIVIKREKKTSRRA